MVVFRFNKLYEVSVLFPLSIAVIETIIKSNLGRKRFIALGRFSPSLREVRARTHDGTLRLGTDIENIEDCFLLGCSSRLTHELLFLYHTRPPTYRWRCLHCHDLGLSHRRALLASLTQSFSPSRFPLPKWLQLLSSWQKSNQLTLFASYYFFHSVWIFFINLITHTILWI